MDHSGFRSASRRRWPDRGDLGLAASLALGLALALILTGPAAAFARAGCVVVSAGLLALADRRRRPLTALGAVVVVVLVERVAAPDASSQAAGFLAVMVGTYSLAAYAARRWLVAGFGLAVAGVAAAQLLGPSDGYRRWSAITFLVTLLVIGPGVVGGLVRTRRRLAGQVEQTAEQLEAGRDVRVHAIVDRERDRVTREVERTVLDGLSDLQAPDPVRALGEVERVEQVTRDLLTEMRRLLGDLRADGERLRPSVATSDLRTQVEAALADGHVLPGAGAPHRGARGRWTLVRPSTADRFLIVGSVAFAAILAAASIMSSAPFPRRLAATALVIGIVLPLVWARRRPLLATVCCVLASVAFATVAAPPDPLRGLPPTALLIVAPLIVGAAAPSSRAVLGLTACLGGVAAASLIDTGAGFALGDLISSAAITTGCWVAGRTIRSGAATLAASTGAALSRQQKQRAITFQALDAERARLARDLHDAIGHALTVIVLQAAAARRVWHSDPPLADTHLRVLQQTLAETLSELRPLLLALALDDTGESHSLAGLQALARRSGNCGLRVSMQVPSIPRLPVDVDSAVYRIVQEALTNAARYAPGANVTVRIADTGDAITIEVVNDAGPSAPAAITGAGRGLQGVAERVASCGGSLDVGPAPDGGFSLSARLPYHRPTILGGAAA